MLLSGAKGAPKKGYLLNEYLLNSKYDKTTLMPGSACDTDMKVDHYLEKKLCSLQIQQMFEMMGK